MLTGTESGVSYHIGSSLRVFPWMGGTRDNDFQI